MPFKFLPQRSQSSQRQLYAEFSPIATAIGEVNCKFFFEKFAILLSITKSYCIFYLCVLCVLCVLCGKLYGNPWGKDADLAYYKQPEISSTPCCDFSPGVALSTALIRFHQTCITQIDGPRSHYLPSSSQYTLDAIQKYGFFKGYILGCDRLLRENDETWIYPTTIDSQGQKIKWDPVR